MYRLDHVSAGWRFTFDEWTSGIVQSVTIGDSGVVVITYKLRFGRYVERIVRPGPMKIIEYGYRDKP
jgi:hypothetical protein